jgi:hypothetical protein
MAKKKINKIEIHQDVVFILLILIAIIVFLSFNPTVLAVGEVMSDIRKPNPFVGFYSYETLSVSYNANGTITLKIIEELIISRRVISRDTIWRTVDANYLGIIAGFLLLGLSLLRAYFIIFIQNKDSHLLNKYKEKTTPNSKIRVIKYPRVEQTPTKQKRRKHKKTQL